MKDKRYKKTIDVYKKLGKEYIKDTYKAKPAELPEFFKLLLPEARILDVGCAGGRDSLLFSKAGYEVIGIDVIDEFIKQAKKRVPKATFKKMDLMKLRFPNNYFNAIWAHAVLLHFKKTDLPKILKQFYKKLKPDGILHVRLKRGRGAGMFREKLADDQGRFFTFYYKHEVEKYLKKAGYKIIKSQILPDELKRKNVKWIGIWARKPGFKL